MKIGYDHLNVTSPVCFFYQASLRMRLRISYTGLAGPVLEQAEVNNFPSFAAQ